MHDSPCAWLSTKHSQVVRYADPDDDQGKGTTQSSKITVDNNILGCVEHFGNWPFPEWSILTNYYFLSHRYPSGLKFLSI